MSVEPQQKPIQHLTSWRRVFSAALIGSIAAYFITVVLSNFHPKLYEFIFISLISLLACEFLAVALLEEFLTDATNRLRREWVAGLTLLLASLLAVSAMVMASQFPGLFYREILILDANRLAVFAGFATLLGVGVARFSNARLVASALTKIRSSRLFERAERNIPGLLLAACFFLVYFTFAETINFPGFRTLDLYFDFDVSLWLSALTGLSIQDIPAIRPVHPAILFFLRPPVWLLSLLLNGNRLHALFLLHALTGASGVFMIWLIVKRMTGDTAFSLIAAFLLGGSASHLLLGSMVETYIYSAFGLILFSFLMHNDKIPLRFMLPAGIFIAGITVSNLAQAFILHLSTRPRIRSVLQFIVLMLPVIFLLNNVQARLYPAAGLLFAPSSLDREQGYRFNPVNSPAWKTKGRLLLTARAITLYGIVAPTPFILDEELGLAGVPHFRTFKIAMRQFHVAGYSGLADVTVKVWILLLFSTLVIFVVNFIKSPFSDLFSSAFLLCLGFNFALHSLYGDDPMLYSPDWVYALVLFVAHAFKPWADRTWLKVTLLVFLGPMATTNLNLIYQIMQISAPLYGK